MMEKILVIKLGALGDFIYACGAMKAIRAHHKNAHITLLTTKSYADLAMQTGYANEIMLDPRPKWFEFFKILAWKKTLNGKAFTRVYDLQNNDRTALYFKLFTPKPEWVGVQEGASHQNINPERKKFHAVLGLQENLKLAGIDHAPLDNLGWMKPQNAITLPQNSVLIVAGSAPSRPQKRWPKEQYKKLCEMLLAQNFKPVLLGTESERAVNDFIAEDLDVLNLTGTTKIFDLPHLARQAVAAVGNDTGPIHILSCVGLPLLALYDTRYSNIQKHGAQGEHSLNFECENLQNLETKEVFEKLEPILKIKS